MSHPSLSPRSLLSSHTPSLLDPDHFKFTPTSGPLHLLSSLLFLNLHPDNHMTQFLTSFRPLLKCHLISGPPLTRLSWNRKLPLPHSSFVLSTALTMPSDLLWDVKMYLSFYRTTVSLSPQLEWQLHEAGNFNLLSFLLCTFPRVTWFLLWLHVPQTPSRSSPFRCKPTYSLFPFVDCCMHSRKVQDGERRFWCIWGEVKERFYPPWGWGGWIRVKRSQGLVRIEQQQQLS